MNNFSRPSTRRPPLGEATRRVNNTQHPPSQDPSKPSTMPHHGSLRTDGLLQTQTNKQDNKQPRERRRAPPGGPNLENPQLSAIKDNPDSKRSSQISTTSTDSKAIKRCIGPWKLGKTLGHGATARVRLARHVYTGQEAAIKIVQKDNAHISQAGSLQHLDKAEAQLAGDGLKQMPLGIEREVAIMKLIQHPHIMRLYDIWENRTEIYLVLEYADKGELFEHISRSGGLREEEAMVYFRQILSAIGYCHSFKICHRDLKPENILMNNRMEIKIADFGMAALHQTPNHRLRTSCGSPHYAAPELVSGSEYRGDLVDMWSIGVVFYAMLAGRLPFDVDGGESQSLTKLLAKIKSGRYSMPPEFSLEAQNLVHRILQVDPRDRIRLHQIWKHPLVRKYDYLDNLGEAYPLSPTIQSCELDIKGKHGIHKDLLRHLRSMWHMYTEQQLIDALMSDTPNEQKMFYSLLLKYRDAQAEDYTPELASSNSDYHHVRPLALTKTYSTCHFPQAKKGHGRQGSKFTVISNGAETEQSYDPFKASRPQHLNAYRNDPAKITIYHLNEDNSWEEGEEEVTVAKPQHESRALSAMGGDQTKLPKLVPPSRNFASRSSLSSNRSRTSNGQVRATLRNKRGVSFSHIRKHASGTQRNMSAPNAPASSGRHSNHTEVTDDGGDVLRPVHSTPASTRYIRSRKAQSIVQTPAPVAKPGRTSQIWSEDVRQLSTSLAKDCDEAFNRISTASDTDAEQKKATRQRPTPANPNPKHFSLDTRPLPAPPARSDSVKNELLEARKHAELRKRVGGDGSPGYLDRMVNHIDRLIQPLSPTHSTFDRRAASAPTDARYTLPSRALPSIHESRGEDSSPQRAKERAAFLEHQRRVEAKNGRIASAPEHWNITRSHQDERLARPVAIIKDTIRVVQPSSPLSPVRPPAPLTIRKKSSQGVPPPVMAGGLGVNQDTFSNKHSSGLDLRQQYKAGTRQDRPLDFTPINESWNGDDQHDTSTGTVVRKKAGWFKRDSKGEEGGRRLSTISSDSAPSKSTSNDKIQAPYDRPQNPHLKSPTPGESKKKQFSFGRIFKKRGSKPEMSVSAHDIFEDDVSVQASIMDARRQALNARDYHEDGRARQIAPQQSWLAKLFHVKPASGFICFSVSQRKARREITALLKDWKRYGIQDIQVNKEKNVVFAKVGAKNFLDMKEVAFAGEIMTVIEHGKRNHLSIARFTQERGAASTFHKLVETLESVMKVRQLLVADERKKRMMIKTLNAAT